MWSISVKILFQSELILFTYLRKFISHCMENFSKLSKHFVRFYRLMDFIVFFFFFQQTFDKYYLTKTVFDVQLGRLVYAVVRL